MVEWFWLITDTMPADRLREFRAHWIARFPAGPEQEEILMQIDGRVALLAARQA